MARDPQRCNGNAAHQARQAHCPQGPRRRRAVAVLGVPGLAAKQSKHGAGSRRCYRELDRRAPRLPRDLLGAKQAV